MFARGFKTWCEKFSAEIREELGLSPYAPLNPFALAEHLGVTVWTPNEVLGLSADTMQRLLTEHSSAWSAFSLRRSDGQWLVVYNPTHSRGRIASDLMHELAHILIGHTPSHMAITASGLCLRTHDKNQEEEASWLAGCLLLPRPALLKAAGRRLPSASICDEYGVSEPMLHYRLNASGVRLQLKRARSA